MLMQKSKKKLFKTLSHIVYFLMVFLILPLDHAKAISEDLEYFKQFLYRVDVDQSDPDFPTYQYRWLMSPYNLKVPLDDQRELNPVISLFLLENGRYKLVYKENIFQKNKPNHFIPGACKVIEGSWIVPDKNLMLDQLAYGVRHMEADHHAVLLYFNQNIVAPVIKGVPISLALGFGNYGIDQATCFPF